MFSQQPDQKNLLLAIVLSMGVLLLWQYLYANPKMKEEQERQKRSQQPQVTMQAPGAPGTAAAPAPPSATPATGQPAAPGSAAVPTAPGAPATTMSREEVLKTSPRVAVETPALRGSIALRGARVDDISLVRYRETVDPRSPNVTLFSPSDVANPYQPYYSESGWIPAAGLAQKMPDRDTVWTAETKGALTPTSPVVLSWSNGQGLTFRRTFRLDANYMFSISDEVENKTGSDITLYPYALIS